NPGKMSFGSAGTGTQAHLAGEQLRLSLGLDLVHVPYGGGGPAAAAALAGHTPIAFTSPAAAVQLIKDGKLRALAVTAKQRTQFLPDVETMTEAGYPDIEGDSWVGLMVPTATPADIVATLHDAVVKILAAPEMQNRLATLGYDIVASTPEEFGRRVET